MPGSTLTARQDVAQGMCSDVTASRGVIAELPCSVLVVGVGVPVPQPPTGEGWSARAAAGGLPSEQLVRQRSRL
eukprot:6797239-Alexandrium_andersonii.AAC.1